MIYSCHYPIIHELTSDSTGILDYTIFLNNEQIYTGNVSGYSSVDGIVEVDLSDVFRVYLQTFYERLSFNGLMTGSVARNDDKATIQTFIVRSDYNNVPTEDESTGGDKAYTVMYDYNKDYIIQYGDTGIRNHPISTLADPRQYIGIVSYNIAGSDTLSYSVNGGSQISYSYNNNLYHHLMFRPNDIGAGDGDTIRLTAGGQSIEYSVKNNCRGRYALYYVNLLGGLDTLLCAGKHIESFGVSRTDAELYDDRRSRMDFQTTRIYQEISNRYQLNTGWLEDDVMDRIDHLIYSPKVWIHDLNKDTVTSCIIDDSSYTVKSFRNDKRLFYTINVTESQKYRVR